MQINGGYYIKARKTQQSDIAHAPPSVREIWDWLLMEANHSDTHICKRGQLIRTYGDIIEGLCWYVGWRKMRYSKHDCENTMKWLKKRGMITTKKTTRGMIIDIANYSLYQDPKNYESHTENFTKATRKPQSSHTINKNEKNVKNDNMSKDIVKTSHGDEDINKSIKYLEESIKGSLDGTQQENRRYCYLLINRFKKDYPTRQSAQLIQFLISRGLEDRFHSKNITNFKYLYYNAMKIIQSVKADLNKNTIAKIS